MHAFTIVIEIEACGVFWCMYETRSKWSSVFHANQHLRCKQTIDYVDEWFDADAEIASLSRTIPPLIAEIVKCAMNLIAFKVPKIPHAHTRTKWEQRATSFRAQMY